jgi:hypothetical protein
LQSRFGWKKLDTHRRELVRRAECALGFWFDVS